MGISESFLVNADRLNPIIDALIDRGEIPNKLTEEELRSIGFDNPSDLLVIHILKELNILDSDSIPTDLFEKLIKPETSKMAVADGIVYAYRELIDEHNQIHTLKPEDLKEKLSDYFKGEKTDLVLKYMANTFKTLIAYAGSGNFEKAYANAVSENEDDSESVSENTEISMNGSSTAEAVSTLKKEEKGASSIEEVLAESKTQESKSNITESNVVSDDTEDLDIVEESNNNEVDTERPEDTSVEQKKEHTEKTDPFNLSQLYDSSETPTPPEMQSSPTNLSSSKKVQQAFIKKADLLFKLDRFEELAPTLNQLINKFDQSDDPDVAEAVSKSVIRRATVLAKLNKNDELLSALNEIIDRFEDSDDSFYYEHASSAMLNKVQLLESKDNTSALLPLYNKVANRLKDSSNSKIKDKVDKVFLNRMNLICEETDDKTLALNAVSGVIERFRNADTHNEYLEEAMFKKASLLEELNDNEEALNAYSEFLERFG